MSTSEADIINKFYPVLGFTIHDGVIELHRECLWPMERQEGQKTRGKISGWSKRSWSKLAFLVRSTRVRFKSFLTLTYGETMPTTVEQSKKDLNRFLTKLRKGRKGFEYVWVLEFQERGAPHYHLLLTFAPEMAGDRKMLAAQWCDSIRPELHSLERGKVLSVHNHKKAWVVMDDPVGAKMYILNYATKLAQKKCPERYWTTGRYWGASRGVKHSPGRTVALNDEQVRRYLDSVGRSDMVKWSVLPKFIWVPVDKKPTKDRQNGLLTSKNQSVILDNVD